MEKYKEYYNKLERLLGGREHRKIVIDGYMPLSIERLGKGEGGLDELTSIWFRNLKEQGFFE